MRCPQLCFRKNGETFVKSVIKMLFSSCARMWTQTQARGHGVAASVCSLCWTTWTRYIKNLYWNNPWQCRFARNNDKRVIHYIFTETKSCITSLQYCDLLQHRYQRSSWWYYTWDRTCSNIRRVPMILQWTEWMGFTGGASRNLIKSDRAMGVRGRKSSSGVHGKASLGSLGDGSWSKMWN